MTSGSDQITDPRLLFIINAFSTAIKPEEIFDGPLTGVYGVIETMPLGHSFRKNPIVK